MFFLLLLLLILFSSSCYYVLSMFVVTFCLSNGKKTLYTYTSPLPELIESHRSIWKKDKVNKIDLNICMCGYFPSSLLFVCSLFSPRFSLFFYISQRYQLSFITHIHIYTSSLSFFFSFSFVTYLFPLGKFCVFRLLFH